MSNLDKVKWLPSAVDERIFTVSGAAVTWNKNDYNVVYAVTSIITFKICSNWRLTLIVWPIQLQGFGSMPTSNTKVSFDMVFAIPDPEVISFDVGTIIPVAYCHGFDLNICRCHYASAFTNVYGNNPVWLDSLVISMERASVYKIRVHTELNILAVQKRSSTDFIQVGIIYDATLKAPTS